MHRLVSIAGQSSETEVVYVQQPTAPVLVLSSAETDIVTLSSVLELKTNLEWKDNIRALHLNYLSHPAQIDHYLSTTAIDAEIIIIRLLGGRGHLSYGLEQLEKWKNQKKDRKLIVLSGTEEHSKELHGIGNINDDLALKLSILMRNGGKINIQNFLSIIKRIRQNEQINIQEIEPLILEDPEKFNWKDDKGHRVAIVFYKSLFQAGDVDFAKRLIKTIRKKGLCPRPLLISSIRTNSVQEGLYNLITSSNCKAIITATSFASTRFDEQQNSLNIWDKLDIPVFQVLTSSNNKEKWLNSSRGLDPIDLSLQIVLPELDGKITTRPCAFRETIKGDKNLSTSINKLKPFTPGINWIASHTKKWIELQTIKQKNKKIAIILSNYPVKNGRLANGVGLDTPESTFRILSLLKENGVNLGNKYSINSGKDLIDLILSTRTNDPQTCDRKPLSYLKLSDYLSWWQTKTNEVKEPIIKRWGEPNSSQELEEEGFAIHGIELGNVLVLIQPSRGYDPDNIEDIHSPDLPPPHRYLAQYLWLKSIHKSNLLIHVGKHGSVEWLPGKSTGLSPSCGPEIVLEDLPIIYPFIVNDPGEGSQAKRRGQAVIIDHLTPPLSRSGLHGDLLQLESLLDEYYEVLLLDEVRKRELEKIINDQISNLDALGFLDPEVDKKISFENKLSKLSGYLCEIKDAQIRTGLHIFGQLPITEKLIDLIMSIARAPSFSEIGFTQKLAEIIKFECDPWVDDEYKRLSINDKLKLTKLGSKRSSYVIDVTDWLENQGKIIIERIYINESINFNSFYDASLAIEFVKWLNSKESSSYINKKLVKLIYKLKESSVKELNSISKTLNGKRVESGPSGSPTRGRTNVLPTGRNFYSVDLRGLPTEAAWQLGNKSSSLLLEQYLLEEGDHLKSLAISVWGTATMRNGGEDIAQTLALLGVKPIWDGPTRRVIDIEVIPLSVLQRPRVDVTLRISGLFRDAFPHLIQIVDQAQNLVSNLDEPSEMNPLSASKKAGQYFGKIYGSAPGSYGAGLQVPIDSGNWENKDELANIYLSWSQWKYTGENEPQKDLEGLKNSLSNIQVVLHNQDNKEHDILDSDDYYQFQGGLYASIEMLGNKKPKAYIGDHSRIERPRLNKLRKELDKVVRSRLLNPKWINGMKSHGYKGGFEMAASLDYLFAYDSTTGQLPDGTYNNIYKSWILDNDTIDFLSNHNPWALRDIGERLLEAHHRGLWKNPLVEAIDNLKSMVISSEAIIEKGF